MTGRGRAPSLVVLQRVEPLTTDVAVLGIPGVVVLTDGPGTPRRGRTRRVRLAWCGSPPPRREWLRRLGSWAADGPIEVVADDDFPRRPRGYAGMVVARRRC